MARILLIDDDAPFRGMLRYVLEREGDLVVEAQHGREGQARYREIRIDLVITDLPMPEEEGLATIRALRRVSPTVKSIAISGGAYQGSSTSCRSPDDWVPTIPSGSRFPGRSFSMPCGCSWRAKTRKTLMHV